MPAAKLLWTGGWDSTFRLLDLTLRLGRAVQPYYVINVTRDSLHHEIRAMHEIRKALRGRAGELVRPTRFIECTTLPMNDRFAQAMANLRQVGKLGTQYEWLANMAESEGFSGLELTVHVDDLVHGFIKDHVQEVRRDGETTYIMGDVEGTDLHIFRRFEFPILNLSKVKMRTLACERGFDELLDLTWFCHTPTRAKLPCGDCNPCRYTIQEGFANRIPLRSRLLAKLGPLRPRKAFRSSRRLLEKLLAKRPMFIAPVRRIANHFRNVASQTLPSGYAAGVFWHHRDDPMSQVHQLANRLLRTRSGNRIRSLLMTCLWPVAAFRQSLALTFGEHGQHARDRGAGSSLRQLRQLWWLAVRHHITPESYYKLELYQPERRLKVNQYLQHHEICALMMHVRVPGRLAWFDKHKLQSLCEAAGIPCIPIVAQVLEGRFQLGKGLSRLPREDLFVKVDNWWGGLGASCWNYDQAMDQWRNSQGVLMGEQQLIEWLEQQTDGRPVIVQPRLFNHPEMARWSIGGLCTLRVMTFWNGGNVQRVATCLRMPTGHSMVDNLASGGLAAWVDQDGRLSSAINKSTKRVTTHPDTGSRIEGEVVPLWDQVGTLASQAHRAAEYPGFVGWDIAITNRGTVVVEANKTPGVELIQMPTGQPLGALQFAEHFLSLLKHPEVAAAITARSDARKNNPSNREPLV